MLLEELKVSSDLFFSFIMKLGLLWKFQLKVLYKTEQKLKDL